MWWELLSVSCFDEASFLCYYCANGYVSFAIESTINNVKANKKGVIYLKTENKIKKMVLSTIYSLPRDLIQPKHKAEGLYFGTKSLLGFDSDFDIAKPSNLEGNVLVIGGPGKGKSSCIAMKTLQTFDGSIVAIDIKGELSEQYEKLLKRGKVTRPFIKFSPMEEDGRRYDPYALLRKCGDEYIVQHARELAFSIIPLPPDVNEPFWIESAQNLFTGAILYYFGLGASFSQTIIGIQNTPVMELIDEIVDSGNKNALMFINQFRGMEVEVLSGIATDMANRIMVFGTDPFINKALGDVREDDNCFTWEEMEKNNIFLCIPEDKIEQWGNVITLMENQLFRVLERRPDKYNSKGINVVPALILLDEFPRLGKMEIANAIATLRSKNVTFEILIQSLAQLDLTYGKMTRQIISDTCSYKVFLGADDPESRQYMSEVVGSYGANNRCYDLFHRANTSSVVQILKTLPFIRNLTIAQYNFHTSKQHEPFIRPEEFSRLKDIVLVTPEGACRIEKYPHYRDNPPKISTINLLYVKNIRNHRTY